MKTVLSSPVSTLWLTLAVAWSLIVATPARSQVDAPTGLAEAISRQLASPSLARAHWGISVTTLDGHQVFARNDAQLFQPASNAKLFTTAAACALIPQDAVYITNIVAEGPLDAAGTLHGALTILGVGDPSMSGRTYPYALHSDRPNPPLAALEDMADQIVRAGVHSIDGGIIGDDTLYPLQPYGTGWVWDDLLWLYGAPVSALTVNDNAVFLNAVRDETAPPRTTATWNPSTTYYTLDNEATVSPAGASAEPGLDRQPGSLAVRLYGTISPDGYHAGLAIQDPSEYAARALTDLLRARGVTVSGQPAARHRVDNDTQVFAAERDQPLAFQPVTGTRLAAPTRSRRIFATHTSPPLIQELTVTNKVSQNLHAELTLRTLGWLYGSDGSFAQGARVVRQFLVNAGIDPGDFDFHDGSGLSTADLVTPRAATQLLAYAARQPWGEAFRSTLPIGGIDGSLAGRFTDPQAKGHVFAKTGTLSETNALSGYVRTASGKMLVFSIFVNDHTPQAKDVLPAMDAVVQALIANE